MAGRERLKIFGIRHHGPGSCWSLRKALETADPAVLLIEGPPEADGLIPFVTSPAMKPPVALLLHASDDPSQAFFYPYAEFSPEWQAMCWAVEKGRPVRFMDLPVGYRIEPKKAEEAEGAEAEGRNGGRAEDLDAEVRIDPLSRLALAAGYDDGETWWNALVEQQSHAGDVFPAIERAMTALRELTPPPADPKEQLHEERREAHMRLTIREALTETQGVVAVVCGAWHVPALRGEAPVTKDRATLKGLKRAAVTATWVPWTDRRLAAASGYGAGVISPGWYRHVYAEMSRSDRGESHDPTVHSARWCARMAHLLRDKGLSAPPASVIEATRLGLALAAIRDLALPGLGESRDAALAVLCGGEEMPYRVIEAELVLGTTVGEVDPEVPQMPLQADLARWQKRLRLEPKAIKEEHSFDLRTEAGLAKSTLLHRLNLIRVPWGVITGAGRSRGTFREKWDLEWEPEYSVRLAEALHWGATVEQAAGNAALEQATSTTSVGELAEIIQGALLADLASAAEKAIDRLQALAASSGEIGVLMEAVPPLAQVLRYGTARKLPEEALKRLVSSLVIEIAVGLNVSSRQLDEEQAETMGQRIVAMDHAVALLDDSALTEEWLGALGRLADDELAAPRPRGSAVRRLHDQNRLERPALERHVSRALSRSVAPVAAAGWLEGFFGGAGQVLLHDEVLLGALDGWLRELEAEPFMAVLPMLRRAFSTLEGNDRRGLLRLVRQGQSPATSTRQGYNDAPPGYLKALPLLTRILGIS